VSDFSLRPPFYQAAIVLSSKLQPILAASTKSTNPIFNRCFEGRRSGERVF
jgi:hypothetical protein